MIIKDLMVQVSSYPDLYLGQILEQLVQKHWELAAIRVDRRPQRAKIGSSTLSVSDLIAINLKKYYHKLVQVRPQT